MRGPTGMRIEDTAFLCDLVEDSIRKQIPPAEMASVIDNIGLPYSGINLSYSNSAPIGTSDADILVTLSPKHHPTADYVSQLRLSLAKEFPGVMFAFLPSDMVTQILNFGLPAPIDIQVIGQRPGRQPGMGEPVDADKSSTCRARLIFESSSRSMSRTCTSESSAQKLRSSASRRTTSLKIFWCR